MSKRNRSSRCSSTIGWREACGSFTADIPGDEHCTRCASGSQSSICTDGRGSHVHTSAGGPSRDSSRTPRPIRSSAGLSHSLHDVDRWRAGRLKPTVISWVFCVGTGDKLDEHAYQDLPGALTSY